MSEMPWVRFFPSDWLGGTRSMSAAETGIYITLIATMYERGSPIVEEPARLARLCGTSNSSFKACLQSLVNDGKIVRKEGGLWNERVAKEVVYRSEKSEVGRKSANARWNTKTNKINGHEYANAMPSQSDRNANQKPEPDIERDTTVSLKKSTKGTRLPETWEPDLAFAVSLGLTLSQAEKEATKFREWWPAQSGQKAVKADWGLTWKSWARRAAESAPRASPKNGKESMFGVLDNLVSKMENQNDLQLPQSSNSPSETIRYLPASKFQS